MLLGAGTASATTPIVAETRVGASTVATVVVVGPHECITAGQRWGHAPPRAETVVAAGVAANSVDRVVIGKVADLEAPGAISSGERTLLSRLPDQGSPRLNWKQNPGVLRSEMRSRQPIRDASVDSAGKLRDNTGFLRAERYLLQDRGWTYDPKTTLWSPGGQ